MDRLSLRGSVDEGNIRHGEGSPVWTILAAIPHTANRTPFLVHDPAAPPATQGMRLRDVLWVTGAGALLAGLGEVALRYALLPQRELLGNRIYLNPQAVWMAPLTNVLLMLGPGLLAYAVGRRVRNGALALPATVLVVGFLSVFAVAMITRRVSDVALAALSLGVASQAARLANRRPALVRTLARRTTLGLGAACLGLSAWVNARSTLAERRMRASLPAPAPGAPNVLLLVLDTVRGLELGIGGYDRRTTPNIDRWAQRGVVFDRAIAPSSWTLPSHASMFTGAWPQDLGVGWSKPFGAGHATIAERMNALGYATGGFAANLIYCSYLFGLDRGFASYHDYQFSPSELLGASTIGRRLIEAWNRARGTWVIVGRKTAAETNAELLHWERAVPEGRPWFAFVNYFDAHDPYDPEAPFRDMFPGTSARWRGISELRVRPPAELRALQAAYDGALAYLDHEVGRLLDDLDQRGVLRNTLVIITADHGEEFGEHGHTGHGSSLYTPVIHVPLVVIPPGEAVATRRVRRYVSLRDLAATIEEAARPPRRLMPGASLGALWAGDSLAPVSPAYSAVDRFASLPPRYPVARSDLRSLVVDDRWHLIRSGGTAELYDLVSDFRETTNLIARPEHAALGRRLLDSLAALAGPSR